MEWVMYLESQADGRPIRAFLKSFDVDAGNDSLTGIVAVTDNLKDALRFANIGSVLECWRLQSRRVPLRPDGEPNRPLTAYTIIPMIADETATRYRLQQVAGVDRSF